MVADAPELGESVARALDAADPLASFRARFDLPTDAAGEPRVYLAGNSLGARPVGAPAAVLAELERWGRLAVDGWFDPDGAWLDRERGLAEMTARLVGARPHEVTTANTLTVNLHLLLSTFFRPDGSRTAILIDAPTFPSDRYAVASHLRSRGLDPDRDLVVIRPPDGEAALRTEDIEAAIHEHRDRLALTLLAGVNYATGQAHDIGRLTAAAHRAGAIAGWDLAHAAGNVPLALHDDGVDFAAWCTYKYLNAGPGALAQLFVHERHADDPGTPRLSGWWGNEPATRFAMAEAFEPAPGADGWRVSTPPILSLAPIGVSLAIFEEVGMDALRRKSMALTAYLEHLVDALVPDATILTPRAPHERGAQLSIRVPDATARLAALEVSDVIGDVREPDIIRLAPAPLYNTWHDAWRAARALAATSPAQRD
jgi:kynureninase